MELGIGMSANLSIRLMNGRIYKVNVTGKYWIAALPVRISRS